MKKFLLFVFIIIGTVAGAQQFSGFPPSAKWKQINTDTARIIFPDAVGSQANRIASIIHKMATQNPNPLSNRLQKINIVLHNNTTLANGYVGLAPFRSEYYLIPATNVFEFGNLPWYDNLAIHEYRHVQQYNSFNRGLTKAFSFLLGQEGRALANSLTVPAWFFEGDAVHAETALTPQGRGRLPYFLNSYRSVWSAGRNYSLMKMLNGSFKDYVPSHYHFGYLVTNYGYQKYGQDFWGKVTGDASAFKGLFYPFRKSLKEHSGVAYKTFIGNALAEYKRSVPASSGLKKETVTNYYFPQFVENNDLIYLKDSYRRLPAFYTKKGNEELHIKLKHISLEDWFSYRNGTIAYTAYATDARWSLKDYSDIVLLDVNTKKEKRLTKKEKYFTPDIAPSGKQLVAVHINEATETELHLIDAANGTVLKKFPTSDNAFYFHPRFIDEDNVVVIYRSPQGAMSLGRINLSSAQKETLLSANYNTISNPFVQDGKIYFTGSFNANDDLYVFDLNNKTLQQVTKSITGNYFPAMKNNQLVYSEFTANGFRTKETDLKTTNRMPVNSLQAGDQVVLFPVAGPMKNLLSGTDRNFAVSNYKKSTGLVNFHSWRPYYEDPEFIFSFFSNNTLNTLSNEVFYRYSQNEKSHTGGFNTSYGGLYPVLTAGAEYTYDRNIQTPTRLITLNQAELRGGYYIPLNFTYGKTLKSLTFGSSYVFSRLMPSGPSKNLFRSTNTSYLSHILNWRHQLPRAVQHIFPKFGYTFYGEHRHRLDDNGYQAFGSAQLFLPSVANHSIVLTGSVQQTDTANFLFSNRFANSRGYPEYYFSKMLRGSANYHFPLLYPDWGFGGIVYFQRLRANAFYDYTKIYDNNRNALADLKSTGGEIYFDTKWWNQLPVTFGFRYSYLLDYKRAGAKSPHVYEFIVPIGLIQ